MTQFDLSADQITRIVGFLGYGRPSAPVWFIGMEEGLGKMSSQDAARNLHARATFEKTMDLHEAHKQLWEEGCHIDIENKPPPTQVWRFMAKIMLARKGEKDWSNSKSAKNYVRFKLGRSNGETFLTELSPIPSSKAADKKWMTLFRTKDSDLEAKISQREEELRTMKELGRSLYVCYGNSRPKAQAFAKLLNVEWRLIHPKICVSHDARCLLLPFFGQGQMSHEVIESLLSLGLLRRSESVTADRFA